jgi:hypothetical protein
MLLRMIGIAGLLACFGHSAVCQAPKVAQAAAPFSICISLQQERAPLGARLPVEIRVTNTSGMPVTVEQEKGDRVELEYSIDFRDSNGHPVRNTDYFSGIKRALAGSGTEVLDLSWFDRWVPPGGDISQQADLATLFQIADPGRYTLQVGRAFRPHPPLATSAYEHEEIKSNVLSIVVK